MLRANSLEKTLKLRKIESRKRRAAAEDEMAGWHHQLNGHEFEQAPGVWESASQSRGHWLDSCFRKIPHAAEQLSHNYWVCTLQLPKPSGPRGLCNMRSHCNWEVRLLQLESRPHLPQPRKAHAKATKTQHKSNEDLAESKVKIIIKKKPTRILKCIKPQAGWVTLMMRIAKGTLSTTLFN